MPHQQLEGIPSWRSDGEGGRKANGKSHFGWIWRLLRSFHTNFGLPHWFILKLDAPGVTEICMGLALGTQNLADTRIQGLTLRSLVGAYELVFGLYVTLLPQDSDGGRATISGARVTLKTNVTGQHFLGFARPEGPFEITGRQTPSAMTPGLYLPLQPGQLAAIESLRGTGDLDFELLAVGMGVDENGAHSLQDTWRIHVPRSDWLKKLREAKARNVLLLEVPLSLSLHSKKWQGIATNLQRAEEHFRNGDYHACVGSCRMVIEELGHKTFKKKDWAGASLGRLSEDRSNMTKAEREAALWGVMRHYVHQAHHGPSAGGVVAYTRSEAQFVLTLTAAAVAHAEAR